MSSGLPVTKQLIDQRAGSLLSQIDRCFRDVVDFNEWINRSDLGIDATYGDAQGLTQLKGAVAAAALLWTVAQGQNAVPNAADFWSAVRPVIGTP